MDRKKKQNKVQKQKQQQQQQQAPIVQEYSPPSYVCLLSTKMGSQLSLNQDQLTVIGSKGYRTILSSHFVIEGNYYFEVHYQNNEQIGAISPQIRIGIAHPQFDTEMSIGSDNLSYAIKSIDGNLISEGKSSSYTSKFNQEVVIGCLIRMTPPKPKVKPSTTHQIMQNEEKQKYDNFQEINEGSQLYYFKDGKLLGLAYQDLKQSFYHAAISLYMHAKATVNFGPEFQFPPEIESIDKEAQNYKPFSDIYNEKILYKDIETTKQ